MYKFTLSDGSIVTFRDLNGSNYVSDTEIVPSMFEGKLSHVVIDGPDTREEHGPMKLVQIQKYGDEWWVILTDLTPQELEHEALLEKIDAMDAQQSWTALMTNTVMEV